MAAQYENYYEVEREIKRICENVGIHPNDIEKVIIRSDLYDRLYPELNYIPKIRGEWLVGFQINREVVTVNLVRGNQEQDPVLLLIKEEALTNKAEPSDFSEEE